MPASRALTPESNEQNKKLKKKRKRELRSLSSIYGEEDSEEMINGSKIKLNKKAKKKRQSGISGGMSLDTSLQDTENFLMKKNEVAETTIARGCNEENGKLKKRRNTEKHRLSSMYAENALKEILKGVQIDEGKERKRKQHGVPFQRDRTVESPVNGSKGTSLRPERNQVVSATKEKVKRKQKHNGFENDDSCQQPMKESTCRDVETALLTEGNHAEVNMGEEKMKEKKRQNSLKNMDLDRIFLEKGGLGLLAYAALLLDGNDEQGSTSHEGVKRKKKKMRKKMHDSYDSNGLNSKPLEEDRLDSTVNENQDSKLRKAKNPEETRSTHKRIKRKKKLHNAPENNEQGQNPLEEGILEMPSVKTKIKHALQRENHAEVIRTREKIKIKKESNNSCGSLDIDQKPLEEENSRSRIGRNMESALQIVGSHGEGNMMRRKIRMEKRPNAPENNVSYQNLLKEHSLDLKWRRSKENPEASFQTAENHVGVSATHKNMERKKRRPNAQESSNLNQKSLEEGSLEFPVARNMEVTLQRTENHEEGSLMEKKAKRKKKRHNSHESNCLDQKLEESSLSQKPLEGGGLELPVIRNLEVALQTTEDHEEVSLIDKNAKRKKKRRNSHESNSLDQKLLEEIIQELLVTVKPVGARKTIEMHEEKEKMKRKKRGIIPPESSDLDHDKGKRDC